jgi:hypothetical protein
VPTSDKAKELFNKLFDMYDQLHASEDPFKKNASTLKQQLRDELKSLERTGMRNVKMIDKDKVSSYPALRCCCCSRVYTRSVVLQSS